MLLINTSYKGYFHYIFTHTPTDIRANHNKDKLYQNKLLLGVILTYIQIG
jgi:hypothetical protein